METTPQRESSGTYTTSTMPNYDFYKTQYDRVVDMRDEFCFDITGKRYRTVAELRTAILELPEHIWTNFYNVPLSQVVNKRALLQSIVDKELEKRNTKRKAEQTFVEITKNKNVSQDVEDTLPIEKEILCRELADYLNFLLNESSKVLTSGSDRQNQMAITTVFSDLPEEILVMIFSKMDTASLEIFLNLGSSLLSKIALEQAKLRMTHSLLFRYLIHNVIALNAPVSLQLVKKNANVNDAILCNMQAKFDFSQMRGYARFIVIELTLSMNDEMLLDQDTRDFLNQRFAHTRVGNPSRVVYARFVARNTPDKSTRNTYTSNVKTIFLDFFKYFHNHPLYDLLVVSRNYLPHCKDPRETLLWQQTLQKIALTPPSNVERILIYKVLLETIRHIWFANLKIYEKYFYEDIEEASVRIYPTPSYSDTTKQILNYNQVKQHLMMTNQSDVVYTTRPTSVHRKVLFARLNDMLNDANTTDNVFIECSTTPVPNNNNNTVEEADALAKSLYWPQQSIWKNMCFFPTEGTDMTDDNSKNYTFHPTVAHLFSVFVTSPAEFLTPDAYFTDISLAMIHLSEFSHP